MEIFQYVILDEKQCLKTTLDMMWTQYSLCETVRLIPVIASGPDETDREAVLSLHAEVISESPERLQSELRRYCWRESWADRSAAHRAGIYCP